MARASSPFDNTLAAARMAADSQTVIALRMLGMAGFMNMAPNESVRMIAEKTAAFTQAAWAAWAAGAQGRDPQCVIAAWIRPVAKTAQANRARLSRNHAA